MSRTVLDEVLSEMRDVARAGFIPDHLMKWADRLDFASPREPAGVEERARELPSIDDHLDSLEGQLRYFLNRIKDFPEHSMVELIDANIRERLKNIRAAAPRQQPVWGEEVERVVGDAVEDALRWLRAALDCKAFGWDEDQHHAAEVAYLNATIRATPTAAHAGYCPKCDAAMEKTP